MTTRVTEISRQLEDAKAHLASLPRPSILAALPWDTQAQQRAKALIEAQALVSQLEHLLGAAVRAGLLEAIETVGSIPEDLGNFALVRRALLLLNAIAKTEENLV